jgi:hypothetical protein
VRVEINETDGRATGVTYVREGDGVERHQRARAVALAGLFDRVELPGYPGGSDLGRQLATLLFGQRDPRVLVGRAPVILQKRPSGRTAPSVGFPPRHHCGHARGVGDVAEVRSRDAQPRAVSACGVPAAQQERD